jgi:hypothetical protein
LGQGDYVKIPSDIGAGLHEATIECWVKWKGFQHYSQPFNFGEAWKMMGLNNPGSGPNLQFFIYPRKQQLCLITVPGVLELNRWYHIAAVTGADGMKLYLDGELVGEHTYTGSFSAINCPSPNYLGRSPWGDNEDFYGELDEVRLWGIARTQKQIHQNMDKRLRGTEPFLVALWNFDTGDARDASPNGYDGTLVGDAQSAKASLSSASTLVVLSGELTDVSENPLGNAFIRLYQNGEQIQKTRTNKMRILSSECLSDSRRQVRSLRKSR